MDCRQQTLIEGLDKLQLSLADKSIKNLLAYVDLIAKWNTIYNLTAITQPIASVKLHLLDSLAVNRYLQGNRILDVGTGAGLPGIPLAIINPDKYFVLLDGKFKKTHFVQQAIIEMGLNNVSVEYCRIEQFQSKQSFDAIISRAFACIEKFITVSWRLLRDNGVILAMKGQPSAQELELIDKLYTVYPLTIPGICAKRCLIKIIKTS